jgi:hypothetical protein
MSPCPWLHFIIYAAEKRDKDPYEHISYMGMRRNAHSIQYIRNHERNHESLVSLSACLSGLYATETVLNVCLSMQQHTLPLIHKPRESPQKDKCENISW